MPGQAFRLVLRVLTLVTAGAIGLSPGMTERIPPGPIPFGPIRGAPDPAAPRRAPATAAPHPAATAGKPNLSARIAPMQLRVVRDGRPGCGEACAEWIAAEGEIVPGTGKAFAGVLRTLGARRLPVFIDSGGGAIEDALAMGTLIRERRLDVAVAQTIADCASCGPGTAQPRSPGAICASACVLVLAAGVGRVGGLATHVGVHQMSMRGVRIVKRRVFRVLFRIVRGQKREIGRELVSERTISSTAFTEPASKETDARVATYLGAMGIGAGLMPLMLSTPATGIRWLTPREEGDTSLLTAATGGETLLLRQHFALAPLPTETPRATSAGSADPVFDGAAKAEITGSVPVGGADGKVVWTLERPPSALPALVAVVTIPASGLALTLRIAPESAAPDAKLVVDAAFRVDGGAAPRIATVGPLHAGSLELSGPPRLSGPTAWRLVLRGDATTLLATPPDMLGLRLRRRDGQAVDLSFDAPERLAAMVALAEKAWKTGAGPKAVFALPQKGH